MAQQYIDLFQTLGMGTPPAGAAGGFLSGTYPNPGSNTTYLNYTGRSLITSGGMVSLSWENRTLVSAVTTLDWGARFCYNSSSRVTIDWGAQQLKTDILATTSRASVDWAQRVLVDNDGSSQCANWGNRLLCYSDSSTALNWSTGTWFYSGGLTAISLASGGLYDTSGNLSVSFANYNLNDSSGYMSLDFLNRQLFDFSGATCLDYGSKLLLDSGGGNALDWGALKLLKSGVTVLDWFSGVLYTSSDGTAVLDFDNRALKDTAAAVQFSWATTGVTVNNKIASYNGTATSGLGVVPIYYSNTLTGQSASVADTTMLTPSAGGFFRVSVYLLCTTGSASVATVSTQIKYTSDDNTAQTVNALSTTNVLMTTTGTFGTGSTLIHVKNGAAIKFNTTVSGTIGTSLYLYAITLEQLI